MTANPQYADEVPRPAIRSTCFVCRVTQGDIGRGVVLVSPSGKAHHSHEWREGDTLCGKDATGDGWWWPL